MSDRSRPRRDVLQLLGLTGAGSLAGCPGNSTDSETLTPARVPTDTGETATPSPDIQRPQTTLRPADADNSDEFGETMAVSAHGTTAVIGAKGDEKPDRTGAGSACVFESDAGTWWQRAKLAAEDGDSFGAFGGSVASSSDSITALLGAESDDNTNGERARSAYVFQRVDGSLTQAAKLTRADGDA